MFSLSGLALDGADHDALDEVLLNEGVHRDHGSGRDEDDGVLHVHFDGTWGCEIDVWFWGDVSYCIESRNPDLWDPYWSTSSIFFENGYIYLVDESDMSAEQINASYCWFKAKHMKYQVIPD